MAMKNFTDMMMSILPQKGASIEKPWHGCHYQSRGEVNRMDDLISRQGAISHVDDVPYIKDHPNVGLLWKAWIESLPSAQPEPLTDKEQRIFLAAMGREEKVCKQVDDECRDCREPYEDSLVRVCHEIARKVKGALWI